MLIGLTANHCPIDVLQHIVYLANRLYSAIDHNFELRSTLLQPEHSVVVQRWNVSILFRAEAVEYCNEALRDCIVVGLMERHLKTGERSSEKITQKDLVFAREQRNHKLISCQLALDAMADGTNDFAKLVGFY